MNASNATHNVANAWIQAIHRKTIKNMSHTEFVMKYAVTRQSVNELILILCGNRYHEKLYFVIKIFGALYEPFAGPHFVQIGNEPPFWVHSLTAFRREFFGLTDKLSFERSVFVCLSNGEVVRLKIARPYLFMPHNVNIAAGDRITIQKTPSEFFYVTNRDVEKHKVEMEEKKRVALEHCHAVRTRIRNHLVTSVQHLFCSYLRDHQIHHHVAREWFRTDLDYAITQCEPLYACMTRVDNDSARSALRAASDGAEGNAQLATTQSFADAVGELQAGASAVDLEATKIYSEIYRGLEEDRRENEVNMMDAVLLPY